MRRIKESEGLDVGSPADAEVNKGASASAWRLRRVLLAVLAVLLFAAKQQSSSVPVEPGQLWHASHSRV
ncbi:hypothetical protein DIPPA_13068 [Diplonema papillatum]|nr:hypothetical protein DIPPA_13068 [Diplonema papillatum]